MELFSMQAATAELLRTVEQLPSQELDEFVMQVLQVQTHRQTTNLTVTEADLLLTINQGPSTQFREELNHLVLKRQSLEISYSELTQLIAMTEQMELWNVDRIQALIKLGQLRSRSLPEIMQDLEINAGLEDDDRCG
jgi:ABC-type uncharacterized transport system ATPase component